LLRHGPTPAVLAADVTVKVAGSQANLPACAVLEADATVTVAGTQAEICVGARISAAVTVTIADDLAWAEQTSLALAANVSATVAGDLATLGEKAEAAVLEAHAAIAVARTWARLSRGESLPPTDEIGWIDPAPGTKPLQALSVSAGGLNLSKAEISDLVIELDDEGGPKQATLTLSRDFRRGLPAMKSSLTVSYGQTLFIGKLYERGAHLSDADAGPVLSYRGPIAELESHKAFRRVYVDRDLDNWRTDQGPQTAANVFEVTATTPSGGDQD
jgi:hypothetical protein